jgi:hypothetical protein
MASLGHEVTRYGEIITVYTITSGHNAGATATVAGTACALHMHKGIMALLNLTRIDTTAPSVSIEVLTGVTGQTTLTTIAVSQALTATGTAMMVCYPGVGGSDFATSTVLGDVFKVNLRLGNDGTTTANIQVVRVP